MRTLALAVALTAGAAFAQLTPQYLPFKMFHDASNPFPYYTDARSGTPAGLSLAQVQTEVTTAWNTWNSVS